jgi:hypothetical protein
VGEEVFALGMQRPLPDLWWTNWAPVAKE